MASPYLQASCSIDQKITAANTAQKVIINTVDDSDKISLDTSNGDVTVEKKGKYVVIAAPQVGRDGDCMESIPNFRCWLRVNGTDVPNSNVLMNVNRYRETKDVIITQGIVELEEEDIVNVMMASDTADEVLLEAIDLGSGEPLIPSIIFTMFQIQSGNGKCL
jgi:hypothetical protein